MKWKILTIAWMHFMIELHFGFSLLIIEGMHMIIKNACSEERRDLS